MEKSLIDYIIIIIINVCGCFLLPIYVRNYSDIYVKCSHFPPYRAATFLGKNLDDTCNNNCSCTEENFFPICGRDNVMYYSPCYAGCETTTLDSQQKVGGDVTLISFYFAPNFYWMFYVGGAVA